MSSTTKKRVDIFINDKQAGTRIIDLKNKSRQLNNEINQLTPGTQKYIAKVNQLKGVNKQLDIHRNKVRGINGAFSKIGSSLGGFAKTLINPWVLGTAAIAGFFRSALEKSRIQEKAVAKVNQAVKSTAGIAGKTTEELQKMASQLQKNTLFGDEDILNNVSAQLLTFTNIRGKEFDRTQKVALDLATVLDGDLKSASIQLGKALNDPVKNLSALSRSGIQFSEDQKKVINSLAKSGQMAEAQAVILDELERQYGGQAEAAVAADGGVTQLKNAWGDFQELAGKGLSKALTPLLNYLTMVLEVLQGSRGFLDIMPQFVSSWANAFDSVNNFNIAMADTIDYWMGWIPGVKEVTKHMRTIGKEQKELTRAQEHQNYINERAQEQTKQLLRDNKEEISDISILVDALYDENTSREEKQKIINKLNEDYPDYVKTIDLENASTEQLIALKKELINSMLQEAIQRKKLNATNELSNQIIDWSIKLTVAQTDAEKKFIQQQIDELTKSMTLVDEIAGQVEQNVNETMANVDLGEGFRKNNEQLSELKNDLSSYQSQLSEALANGDKTLADSLRERIQKTQEQIAKYDGIRVESLNGALDIEKKYTTEHNKESKKRIDQMKKEAEAREKMLQKLSDTVAGLYEEANNRQRVNATDENSPERELEELEIQLEKKFIKHIEAAEELAKAEGEVGERAQEELDSLRLLWRQEYEEKRLLILEKYHKKEEEIAKKAEVEKQKQLNGIRDAQLKLQILKAASAVNDQIQYQGYATKELYADLITALQERAEYEKELEANKLRDQLENKAISQEEFNLRMEELELSHQQRLTDIQAAEEEKRRSAIQETITKAGETMLQVLNVVGTFDEALTNNRINKINEEKEAKLRALDAQLKKGVLTESQYQEQKERINSQFARKEALEKNDQAKRQRAYDLTRASINTALGITKAIPNPLLMTLAGLTGAAQIALIASKKVDQFKHGGYNVTGKQDGRSYNASYLGSHPGGMLPNSPSLVLASEQGAEYFVPHPLLSDPRVAQHVKIIEAIRTNQMAEGGFSGNSKVVDDLGGVQMTATNSVLNGLSAVVSKLSQQVDRGIYAKVDDQTVDDISDKQNHLAEIKGG